MKEPTKRNYSKEFEEEDYGDYDYDDREEEDGLMETNFGTVRQNENENENEKRSYSNLTRYTFENLETRKHNEFQTRNVKFLFDKLVFLEDECRNPKFIDYLIKNKILKLQKQLQTILLVLWNMNLNIMENHIQIKMV